MLRKLKLRQKNGLLIKKTSERKEKSFLKFTWERGCSMGTLNAKKLNDGISVIYFKDTQSN